MDLNELCWCKSGKKYGECHAKMDEHLAFLKTKGYHIPPHSFIKNEKQIEGIRLASIANTKVLDAVAAMIKPGISTQDIDDVVVKTSHELGGKSADYGYEGFPKSVCVSVNDVVCHGIPSRHEILHEGDIVNVDCTTFLNGYYGDSSRMFMLGNVKPNAERLCRVTKEALDLCVATLKPYDPIGNIGDIIVSYTKKYNYSVVKEIGGHGVGLALHEDPFVSHVARKNTGVVLAPGMVFTIEPMVNEGRPYVWEDQRNGWTIRTRDGKLSAQWEYTLLMTETGLEVLAK